ADSRERRGVKDLKSLIRLHKFLLDEKRRSLQDLESLRVHFDTALARVNDSVFGLQAGVFTNQPDKAMRSFNQLEVGGVVINDVPTFRVDNMPYGGVKDSGFGREGLKYSIEEMTEIKLLIMNNYLDSI
ncbi:MAG: aldehyde dehydrogenase family protein, partial [Nitrospinae bacterium]|nr:aldehyde dehydrogenase family protein [Nitrospinota bacterium]